MLKKIFNTGLTPPPKFEPHVSYFEDPNDVYDEETKSFRGHGFMPTPKREDLRSVIHNGGFVKMRIVPFYPEESQLVEPYASRKHSQTTPSPRRGNSPQSSNSLGSSGGYRSPSSTSTSLSPSPVRETARDCDNEIEQNRAQLSRAQSTIKRQSNIIHDLLDSQSNHPCVTCTNPRPTKPVDADLPHSRVIVIPRDQYSQEEHDKMVKWFGERTDAYIVIHQLRKIERALEVDRRNLSAELNDLREDYVNLRHGYDAEVRLRLEAERKLTSALATAHRRKGELDFEKKKTSLRATSAPAKKSWPAIAQPFKPTMGPFIYGHNTSTYRSDTVPRTEEATRTANAPQIRPFSLRKSVTFQE